MCFLYCLGSVTVISSLSSRGVPGSMAVPVFLGAQFQVQWLLLSSQELSLVLWTVFSGGPCLWSQSPVSA